MNMTAFHRFHPSPVWAGIFLFLALQVGFSARVASLGEATPDMPAPLGRTTLKALSFGDDQMLFRATGLWLQGIGDGGGRVKPLRDYDYDRVVGWLRTMDGLDERSDYGYSLAAHYFGAVSDPDRGPERVGKIAAYLFDAGMRDPEHRWSWLAWAATRPRTSLKDPVLIRRMADGLVELKDNPKAPDWLVLLAPPLYRAAGEAARAKTIEDDPRIGQIRLRVQEELADRLRESGGVN